MGRRFTSPSCLPLDSARHTVSTAWLLLVNGTLNTIGKLELLGIKPSIEARLVGPSFSFQVQAFETGRSTPESTGFSSLLLLACFLAAAFASQCFLDSLSLAGLQVKRVTLDFLDDVLGLYLTLEPPKRVFKGFTLLKSNFRQRTANPLSVPTRLDSYGKPYPPKSSGMYRNFHYASKIHPHGKLHLPGCE